MPMHVSQLKAWWW